MMRGFLLACVLLLGACGQGDVVPVRVMDGDTMEILHGKHAGERLRIALLNTPERRSTCPTEEQRRREQVLAEAATERMRQLSANEVRLTLTMQRNGTTPVRDRYGRLIGSVADPRGRDLAEIMIKEGHGRRHEGGRSRPEPWC